MHTHTHSRRGWGSTLILAITLTLATLTLADKVEEQSFPSLSRLSFAPLASGLQLPAVDEPLYVTSRIGRANVLRTHFDPAGGVGMQQDIGLGMGRRDSAAGAEGLSSEPCYGPGPCFGDSPTSAPKPKPVPKKPCKKKAAPPPPPPPPPQPQPLPPPPPKKTKPKRKPKRQPAPQQVPFPDADAPHLPPATPPQPDCGDKCNPIDSDPKLAKVSPAPLPLLALAKTVGEEGPLKRVLDAIQKRQQHLENQQAWLVKAAEAVRTVKREIERAEKTKKEIVFDIEQLKSAQDYMTNKYRADQLKWRYKDLKYTLERLRVKNDYVQDYKKQLLHRKQEKENEVTAIKNSIPDHLMEYITEEELNNPTKIIDEIERTA